MLPPVHGDSQELAGPADVLALSNVSNVGFASVQGGRTIYLDEGALVPNSWCGGRRTAGLARS